MKKRTFAFLVALLTFIVGVAIAKVSLPNFLQSPTIPQKQELRLSNYRLSGPYQHENLTVFLVHGPNQPDSRMFIPLPEAMERNLVIVHETSEVNELAIENVSASEVFVQAGDIVKGGRQDRVLAVDLILPAKSGRMPIAAFCVEQSRWSVRGVESADHFSVSADMISTKDLKLATRLEGLQHRVWEEVKETQQKLSTSVSSDVPSEVSPSSLQLAQENEQVQTSAAAYIDKLLPIVATSNDVIGFAFAIHDKLNSADVYSSSELFRRFWPRLLKTAAIEAVAERAFNEKGEPVTLAMAGEFLVASENGAQSVNDVTTRTRMVKLESEKNLFFETRDMAHGGAWIHRSYLTK